MSGEPAMSEEQRKFVQRMGDAQHHLTEKDLLFRIYDGVRDLQGKRDREDIALLDRLERRTERLVRRLERLDRKTS